MTAALLYRRNQRWQIWAAFAAAAAIHIAAVAMAANRSHESVSANFDPGSIDVEAFDSAADVPPQIPPASIPEPPATETNDETFPSENPTPVRRRKINPMTAIPTHTTGAASPSTTSSSVKVLALSKPRPDYPYEARRRRATGSGVAVLTINPLNGNVIEVRMSQSTGNAILDNATMSGLRRWRFRPGNVTSIQVPITFTLTGAVY